MHAGPVPDGAPGVQQGGTGSIGSAMHGRTERCGSGCGRLVAVLGQTTEEAVLSSFVAGLGPLIQHIRSCWSQSQQWLMGAWGKHKSCCGGASPLVLLATATASAVALTWLLLLLLLPLRCPSDAPGVMEEPEQWQVLADGYCAAGLTDAAIALVTDKLGSLGKAHER